MRIAVISDIHGNWAALDTVMRDIAHRRVDKIICGGDVIDPMPQSRKVLEFLMREKIPTLRGNHEDYVVDAFSDANHRMSTTIQYLPVKVTASSFDRPSIEIVKALPFSLVIESEAAGDIYFCHASPISNVRGWRYGLDPEIEASLKKIPQNTLVCGHWHDAETRDWEGKTLITVGSVGVPLTGRLEPEYTILTAEAGRWSAEHLTVKYDPTPTLEEYARTGWLKAGGPIGWILFHEVATANRTIVPFIKWQKANNDEPASMPDWERSVERYLRENGDWNVVTRYL